MHIENHRLHVEPGQPALFVATPNQSCGLQPLYLVVHFTAGLGLDGAVSWLASPAAKASAHVVIGRDGRIVQMVPFNRRAWHAGASRWRDLVGLNAFSIGIELDNGGKLQRRGDGVWTHPGSGRVIPTGEVITATHKHETTAAGWHEFTQVQIATAERVGRTLCARYRLIDVLGHDDIAPERKVDPGPAFPMTGFRARVLGRS